MELYALTANEIDTINALNAQRTNVLLIPFTIDGQSGVDPTALQDPAFAAYATALGGYDQAKVVEVTGPTRDLEEVRTDKLAELAAWWTQLQAAGWDTGQGYSLKISPEDQYTFASFKTFIGLAVEKGAMTAATQVAIYDTDDEAHMVAASDVDDLLLGYGTYCMTKLNEYKTFLRQIKQATTIAELEVITIS